MRLRRRPYDAPPRRRDDVVYLPLRWCDRCAGSRPHGNDGRTCLGCLAREQREATS